MQFICMTLEMGGEFGNMPPFSPSSQRPSRHAKPILQKPSIAHQILFVRGYLTTSESHPFLGGIAGGIPCSWDEASLNPQPTHLDTGSLVPRRD